MQKSSQVIARCPAKSHCVSCDKVDLCLFRRPYQVAVKVCYGSESACASVEQKQWRFVKEFRPPNCSGRVTSHSSKGF